MIHRNVVIVVGLLACLSGVMPSEQPASPWQVLNPSLGSSAQQAEGSAPEQYEVPVPERQSTELTEEEEFLVNNMPFKLPFKMDKKQLAVAMKLLKAAAKPIIKSKMLREAMATLDELVATYVDDMETQLYLTLILDTMQNFYDGKEATQFDKVMRGFFTDLSGDEQTGRTIDGVWRSTMQYVYDPMRNYFRNYLVDPISNAFTGFARRIGRLMGNDGRKKYISVQYPDEYSWSDTVSNYARQFSAWTSQARMGLEVAARMLEAEDARGCKGCVYPEKSPIE